jgi:hypothetical protein
MAQGAGERSAVERHFARSIPALLAVTPDAPATVVSRAAPGPGSGDAGGRPILLAMESGQEWVSHTSIATGRAGPAARDDDNRPELADVGRLARRLLRRAVSAARAEENSIWHLLAGHLGPGVATLPVASGNWP